MRRVALLLVPALGACAPQSDAPPIEAAKASLSTSLGPEVAIGAPAFGYRSQTNQDNAKVAFDGVNYLIAWRDDRAEQDSAIYAARVNPAGQLLDPAGILIADGVSSPWIDVTFNGASFVIAWTSATHDQNTTIRAALLSRSGDLQTPQPILIAQPSQLSAPRMASRGGITLLSWTDSASGGVYAARMSSTGAVLDNPAIPVAHDQGVVTAGAALASNGDDYLIAWSGGTANYFVRAAMVDAQGSVTVPAFEIATNLGDAPVPDVASNGVDYMVAWRSAPNAEGGAVSASAITSTGSVVDPGGRLVHASGNPIDVGLNVAGSTYIVHWLQKPTGGVEALRMSGAAEPLDSGPAPLTDLALPQNAPDVAVGANNLLLVTTAGTWKIHAATITIDQESGLRASEPFYVGQSANRQQRPAFASDGQSFFAVWEDLRDSMVGSADLYGLRLDPDLNPLDAESFAVSATYTAENEPALAYGAGKYLVLWWSALPDRPNIYAKFVTPDGVVGAERIRIAPSSGIQFSPAAASDGRNFLVAWQEIQSEVDRIAVRAAHLDADGTLYPGLLDLSPSDVYKAYPAVAFGDGKYLVVWAEAGANDDYQNTVRGALVTPHGSASPVFEVSPRGGAVHDIAVVFDGVDFVVGWTREDAAGSTDVFASRVTSAGVAKDAPGAQLTSTPEPETGLRMAYDGELVTAVWDRGVSAREVVVSRFELAGLSGNPPVSALREATPTEGLPAIAALGAGRAAAVYQRFGSAPRERVVRTYGRTLQSLLGAGASCTESARCESGICSDGVCCESTCSGQCEACNQPGAEGRCVAVQGQPVAGRPPCEAATCDGIERSRCVPATSEPPARPDAGTPSDGGDPVDPPDTTDRADGCACRTRGWAAEGVSRAFVFAFAVGLGGALVRRRQRRGNGTGW